MKVRRSYTMTSRADAVASTKERIATAALELLMERRFDDVTLTDIAAAAGVSHQTVLNHFESKEGVAFAAADLLVASTNEARSDVAPGDTVGAIRRLVADYEQIGDANARWAMEVEHLGSLAPLIEQARHSHRAWLEAAFEPYLPADGKARRRVVNALHAATDVYTWKLLRRDLGVTRAETERTMVRLVDGTLGRLDGDT
jgi:AcrR family transcriptional regulator